MPELPDVDVYVEHLARRTVGHPLEKVRLASPFVLRTVDPPIAAVQGQIVAKTSRLGKRIVFTFAAEKKAEPLHLVIHLMVAGRFKWKPHGTGVPGRIGLAAFDFGAAESKSAQRQENGTLILTEASTKKRASIHVVRGRDALLALAPAGLEVLEIDTPAFAERLRSENHTLKRSLTDPHLFSGIGNAYSDEILHDAQMSPVKLASRITDDEVARLHASIRKVLVEWRDRLLARSGEFPENVTAFQPEMAVHGKYGKPCPRCGGRVQRIRYADNEMNYCPPCQTEGKLLADRSLSRLMRGDWPKTLDDLEAKKERSKAPSSPALAPVSSPAPASAAEPAVKAVKAAAKKRRS